MADQPVVIEKGTSNLRAKLAQVIIALLMALALSVYIVAAVLAVQTARRPFLGALVEPTLVINAVGDDGWNGRAAGLDLPDHIVALDGQPLTRPWSLYNALSAYRAGDTINLTLERPEGDVRTVPVELQPFPTPALISFFVFPYGIGLAFLLIGLVVFVARHNRAAGRAFPVFCLSFGLIFGTFFDLYTTHRLTPMWVIGFAVLGGSLIDLALVFPQRSRLSRRWPWLTWLVYAPSVVIALWALATTTDLSRPWAYIPAWRPLYFYTVLGSFVWVGMLIRRWLRTDSPVVREQVRIILLGLVVGSLPIVTWLILATLRVGLDFQPTIMFAPLILLPLSIAYAILRYRLLDVDLLISHGISYSLLTLLIVGSYLLLVNLLGLVLGTSVAANNPVVVALFVFGVTLVFNPLRTRLHQSIELLFFRGRISYRQELVAYGHALGRLFTQSDIFAALAERVETAVHPNRLMFFVYDESAAQFVSMTNHQGSSQGARFMPDGDLAQLLLERQETVYLRRGQPLPPDLEREAPKLELVGASLYIPLPRQGWMALGEKRSGEPYTTDDLVFLEALGDQTSLALDRVQLISDLERRVNELNALRRISQAINFAVGLDALLELIFTQTSRVLGVNNFFITLYDKVKETLCYAFYVENDERLYPEEEWPLEDGGLVAEIVRSGQSIVTDDYVSECSRRGIPPGDKHFRAWMGMPLSADDQVIGVMNVSSSDPGLRYSPDQLGLFSAIAVQAAAIINKTRRDEEIAQRARQLAILNQVSSAINSTLDLQQVLQLITEKAAEILNAESGSLWLTDASTGASVFEIAVGPSSENLVGLRLGPGTGIVGATAETQEPILVNDIQKDERHFSAPAESIDFTPRAMISVPLVYQERTVGVLQILNKKDGSPFDEQDTQLMLAFAAQAAVALENARLFTMTDQALADRVEELSMFQRIDRALNATLDYVQVMELTLNWAMRETGAKLGVVAALDEERGGLFIVASHGFPPEYDRYRENPWLVSEGVIGRAVRIGEPVVVDNVAADADYVMAVPETRSQLAVPLRLGEEVIGVISLESPEIAGFGEHDVQFVIRLAERAVVPIENAHLYDQVKRANDAKSQVISMVAHELKNPLTSIGGYARLLELSGGPMDDTKRNFTRTIIANVERMRTTVDDLLDISRVERGLLKLEMEEVSMASVIGETLDSLRNAIEEKGLALRLEIPEDLPLVWGDRTRLVQVLVNLVDNARKYTPDGSIFISAAKVELLIPNNGHMGQFVRCSVRDTGIGIAKEDQERLFKSQFTRFDNARDVAKGYGLGLWLVNRLMQMQGGEILVESEIGQGSTFSLTVPVVDSHIISVANAA